MRAAYEQHVEQLAGLESVFDQIGQHLDDSFSQPATNKLLRATGRGIVIAISDVRWRRREFVLITEFGVEEIGPLMKKANDFFDACETDIGKRLEGRELPEAVCACWIHWSRHAYKCFRRRLLAWNDLADVSVGALFLASPDVRQSLHRIAQSGNVPVLAVGLNTADASAAHLKCNVRYVALALPTWMRASGSVTGHA